MTCPRSHLVQGIQWWMWGWSGWALFLALEPCCFCNQKSLCTLQRTKELCKVFFFKQVAAHILIFFRKFLFDQKKMLENWATFSKATRIFKKSLHQSKANNDNSYYLLNLYYVTVLSAEFINYLPWIQLAYGAPGITLIWQMRNWRLGDSAQSIPVAKERSELWSICLHYAPPGCKVCTNRKNVLVSSLLAI